MPEHEPQPVLSCDVCGRTILRGERVYDYLTPDREHRGVCALCRERAEADGWIRADSDAARAHSAAPRRRRGLRAAKLRERVARASEQFARASERVRRPREPEGEAQTEAHGPARPRAAPPQPEAKPRPEPAPTPPPEPDTAERRVRRAVATFNEAEQARVVAGLIKSLGEPQAAVHDRSRKPPRVDITIAWELSWYRWEVLLDSGEVRELSKGAELSELEGGEPDWNASVDGEGKLHWLESSS